MGNRLPGRIVDDYLMHGYCARGKDKYGKDITYLLRARTVFRAIGGSKVTVYPNSDSSNCRNGVRATLQEISLP